MLVNKTVLTQLHGQSQRELYSALHIIWYHKKHTYWHLL